MKFMFIGDIVGRPGRRAVRELLPGLRARYGLDCVIANGENAAGGFGITREVAKELFGYGIDLITMGNHTWDKKDTAAFISEDNRVLRPQNLPSGTPGAGYGVIETPKGRLGVVLLLGRVYMDSCECPFRQVDTVLDQLRNKCDGLLVDIHAEATSEKVAIGWYLDGRATAVLGTHTHVQTSDGRRLARGTGYCTDVGMTGARDSVLGMDKTAVIAKFITLMPQQFEVAKDDIHLCAAIVEMGYDGLCRYIEVIDEALS